MFAAVAAAQGVVAPEAAFLQVGATTSGTEALTLGLLWRWPASWAWSLGGGRLDGRWEASLSAWSFPAAGGAGRQSLGQIAFTPLLRYSAGGGAAAWYAEAGIGASCTTSLYVSERTQFSTSFNFGDQLALGWVFGPLREHELSLRFEHFSNANLKRPNPGEEFVQLRYARRLP